MRPTEERVESKSQRNESVRPFGPRHHRQSFPWPSIALLCFSCIVWFFGFDRMRSHRVVCAPRVNLLLFSAGCSYCVFFATLTQSHDDDKDPEKTWRMRSSARCGIAFVVILSLCCTRDLDTHSFFFDFLSRNPVNESFSPPPPPPRTYSFIFSHRNLNHRHRPHSQCHKIRTDLVVEVVVVIFGSVVVLLYWGQSRQSLLFSFSLTRPVFFFLLFIFLIWLFFICLFNLLFL